MRQKPGNVETHPGVMSPSLVSSSNPLSFSRSGWSPALTSGSLSRLPQPTSWPSCSQSVSFIFPQSYMTPWEA